MRLITPLLLCALLPLQTAVAAGVHQHGVAQLDLVLDPPMLAVSIRSPLANLVGFEHRPMSEQEQADWTSLQQQLQQAGHLLQLPAAADCSLSKVALHQPFKETDTHDAHSHSHDQHDHSSDDEYQEHADLMVEYHYLCADSAQLKQLQLPLMKHYPGIERLDVQLITPSGQHLSQLRQGETLLELP
ncbi:ZrgA family zinc uptake protein [Marinobacterium iners]|uniref:Zinc-binding protein n=1 Tax=Marinobacterium iners DSM 11526 TaxID=1122198 RepID=A0A1H4FIB1_9GAMM|nr:DUF2796 domain-containing protein [Marinobacterium iners]SEA96871.1 Protein of unknown function [Marinobacterium iners DSM 11526]